MPSDSTAPPTSRRLPSTPAAGLATSLVMFGWAAVPARLSVLDAVVVVSDLILLLVVVIVVVVVLTVVTAMPGVAVLASSLEGRAGGCGPGVKGFLPYISCNLSSLLNTPSCALRTAWSDRSNAARSHAYRADMQYTLHTRPSWGLLDQTALSWFPKIKNKYRSVQELPKTIDFRIPESQNPRKPHDIEKKTK